MKPITDVLREMRKGRVVDDATQKLAVLVESEFNLLRDDPNQRELFGEVQPRASAQAAE